MRLALTALFVLGLLATSQGRAQAQQAPAHKPSSVYVFEGFSYQRIHGELASQASEMMQLQIGLGYQPSNSDWAYELMGRLGGTVGAADSSAGVLGWGVRAKRFHRLAKHFHLYGRAGITENALVDLPGPNLVGFGVEYGMGAMASVRVRALGFLFWPAFFFQTGPKVNLSLWADVGGEFGNLHSGHESSAQSYNYRTTAASYGINVGGRF